MKVSGSLVKNCYMSFLVANAATTATHSALVLETKAVDPGPLDSLITRFLSQNGTMTLNAFVTMVINVIKIK